MLSLDFLTLETMIAQFALPLCRISAMLSAMSVIGSRTVSQRARIVLSVSICVCIAPTISYVPSFSLFSANMALAVAQEVIIGLGFGFVSRLLLETFILGAQIIAMQTGLGFASMVDPSNGLQVPVLSQFYLLLVTLMFLTLDGHLIMIRMIVESFITLPIGSSGLHLDAMKAIIDWASYLFSAGLMMSLSAVLSLLMINISFGVMTRAAPQLNIFSVGFPITLISGLLIVWFTLSGFQFHFRQQFDRSVELMCKTLQLICQ